MYIVFVRRARVNPAKSSRLSRTESFFFVIPFRCPFERRKRASFFFRGKKEELVSIPVGSFLSLSLFLFSVQLSRASISRFRASIGVSFHVEKKRKEKRFLPNSFGRGEKRRRERGEVDSQVKMEKFRYDNTVRRFRF